MIAINYVFDAGIGAVPFSPPAHQTPVRNPPSLFEYSRLKVKKLLLTRLSAEWTRIWIDGQFESYQYNFIKFASSVQLTVDYLSRGEIPDSVASALALRGDLQKIVTALSVSAPWTRFMNIIHPTNSRKFSNPRFFARMYVLFSLSTPFSPFPHSLVERPPVSVETWFGIMDIE